MRCMLKILIIDDDVAACQVLKESFARLGFKSKNVVTAEEGIEILKKEKFDVVFAALSARINGGRSVARWIKNNNLDTYCFITTSWKGELETELLRNDGVHKVIHKPLTYNQIKAVLGESFLLPDTSKIVIPKNILHKNDKSQE
ncbi:MAG: response regulator [Chitinivibrionales bacterium]|nr:response regulator [Chitinivibrionales bacterium]